MSKTEKFSKGFDTLLETVKMEESPKATTGKEKMTTANFRIPVSIHKELKKLAIERETTLMDMISEAIIDYIEKQKQK